MKITGIICEYNPLHLGHAKQLRYVRKTEPEGGIVCLMSGNFVQRGTPAILDKTLRAQAAVKCGADLVLELPVTASLSSAEGFAKQGVAILSSFCHNLCFGAETGDLDVLWHIANILIGDDFPQVLRQSLDLGLSFPAARQKALESLGCDGSLLTQPNNILAVEYCKAILTSEHPIKPMVIARRGNYHDTVADAQNPSATAIRERMVACRDWTSYLPAPAADCFAGAKLHQLCTGERAILGRLRTMTPSELEALPYGSEGLWRKLMHAVQTCGNLDEIFTATKSKRYTRTRLNRMVMCAFLGITQELLCTPVPYVRVLAFNDTGREILKKTRTTGSFPNIGEPQAHPYQSLEDRWGNLYGLFADPPDPAGQERNYRVYYEKSGGA